MKNNLLHLVVTAITLSIPLINFAQAPSLGTAANFVLFSSNGAVSNTGKSHLTGNVGAQIGSVTNFGNVDGVMHSNDGSSSFAAADLLKAYYQLDTTTATASHAALLGNGDTMTAGVYKINEAASFNDTLILDGKGQTNPVFIFQIQGAFSSTANAFVKLINNAKACNIFWKAEGAVSFASGTTMRGSVIANNAAIGMGSGVVLEGRALSTTGAVGVNGVTAYTPLGCGTPVLNGPVAPSLASINCYAIFSGNGNVTNSNGTSTVTGDIGTNVGTTNAYDPAYVTGTIHSTPDSSTSKAAADLLLVSDYLNGLPVDIQLLYPSQFGSNLVLTPHTYLLQGSTAFTDTLFLNAQGNPDAVFVIKVNGALSTTTQARVRLINGAQAKNVFWRVEGAVTINTFSDFKGTIVCKGGAINLFTGTVLEGRALTTDGALSTSAITATMTAGCGTLPLNMLYFRGVANQKNTVLEWSTASEQNTANFEIEQSADAKNYTNIGTVNAAGNSTRDKTYSFTDHSIASINSPVVYYRLKLKDADNKFTYSKVVALQLKRKTSVVFLYPNPVKETATITITVKRNERITYNISDNAGRILISKYVNLTSGSNLITISVKELAVGMYNLSLQGEQTKEKINFVKQ